MDSWRIQFIAVIAVLAAIGLAISANLVNPYFLYIINLTLINAIAAIGLVILSGVAGQMSLGTAAFLAIGAYTMAILMNRFGLGFVSAGLLGAFAALAIGTPLTVPALRLTGLHLSIVTLAFGVIIVQLIGKGGDLTGGMSGLAIPQATFAGISLDTDAKRFWLIATVFLVVLLSGAAFLRLKPGRALLALRDSDMTARSLGINTVAYKMIAFAYSSFLAGLAGALYAMLTGYISVDDFTIWMSLYFFVMITIGGTTSVVGALVGAIFVTVLPELLRGFSEAANAVFGVILMLAIIFLPGGLISSRHLDRLRFRRGA